MPWERLDTDPDPDPDTDPDSDPDPDSEERFAPGRVGCALP